MKKNYLFDDSPHEECGIVGVHLPMEKMDESAASLLFYGLHALQHRGQEAAGIVVSDSHEFAIRKGTGLISQIFRREVLTGLVGRVGVGHTRYSTTGSPSTRNIQPYVIETASGPLALAHNGNITNASALRQNILSKGIGLTSSSDSEVLLMMIAGAAGSSWIERISDAMRRWYGAFSLIISSRSALYAVRDPWGFRPLCVGEIPNGGGYVVASETCALDTLGATCNVFEVLPGELVRISDKGIERYSVMQPRTPTSLCVFEHIYFSRADSIWDGQYVNVVRENLGAELAKEAQVDADVVIGVPSTSLPAAIGYAHASGIPYASGLMRNKYVGRTFIEPTDAMRKAAIRLKFNSLPSNLKGRRVIVIDDSIVRGNTSKALMQLLRDAGTAELHLRITCPPIRHSCFMGVDMGQPEDLISHNHTPDEIRDFLGVDSLHFLSLEGMMRAVNSTSGYCGACFTGDYPFPMPRAGKLAFEGANKIDDREK